VSSIALGAIHAQRAGNRTQSPKLAPPPKIPTPPPPRDDKTKFSALGMGGPSDWEHFGAGDDEVDDEEIFGVKKEYGKDVPAELMSEELPARVPSPPSTQEGWPSPASQMTPLNVRGQDSYQPTPPISSTPVTRPASQVPQQSFVMGDAPPSNEQQSFVIGDAPIAPPNTSQTPQPTQHTQTPPAQQASVMDNGWAPAKQGTPVQQPAQHHPPPVAQQSFVMGDGAWTAPVTNDRVAQGTPVQAQYQPPANSTYVVGEGNWEESQQASTQAPGGWETQASPNHLAELKAKDEAYERLRADAEKEKADHHTELNKLNVVIESVKSHAESERRVLVEQIDALNATATQAKSNTDASDKQKNTEIERLKEDAEGKDDTIKERDATIAQIRKQLQDNTGAIAELRTQLAEKDNAIANLQQQLDAEKSREVLPPTPAGLIPDLNPWYASSLERYIAMLRSEASEPLVEDKIKAFKSFLKSESGIRGLDYYSDPPPPQAIQESSGQQKPENENIGHPRGTSNVSAQRQDLNVQVPSVRQESHEDEFDYSPGGRPFLRSKHTIKSNETPPTQQSFNGAGGLSSQSTAVLTPTSSQDEDLNKTPTPMQSPPEEQPQPQYKAYVPPGVSQAESSKSLHRQSVSSISTPPIAPLQTSGSGKNHDEIFFGAGVPEKSVKPTSKPNTGSNSLSDVPLPAPLFTPQPPATPAPAQMQATQAKKDPLDVLNALIPSQVAESISSELEDIRHKLTGFSSEFSFIQENTSKWDRSAALARKKNDDARRKRQEQSEAHTDELFNDNQISYADIGEIEDEFKEKERELKAQEDRDEYKAYVENVFDNVYDDLQSQIKDLMDLYIKAENLIHTSVSGVKSMEGGDIVGTEESLKLLKQVHDSIEARHEKVVLAVAERDKRYKKTEIQPLYAAGNISKMKNVEKHFENAEKQAVLRAKSEKAERVDGLVRVVEEVVVSAVGIDQGEIESILAAVRDLPEKSEEAILTRARETLLALKGSTKTLLELFNNLEIELNNAVIEAEIAQARAENAAPERIKELEMEMAEGEKKARDEFLRRVEVIDQDKDEIDRLIEEKGGKTTLSEEEEKKIRMQRALEEAKRRNGDL
jgi:hypothetical protein